ncbi:MAG: hypothetical protein Q9202_001300 [Teloschistes flavicans]
MIPLSGTSTGSAGKASPHLQAWLDEKKAAEEKRRALEGEDPSKKRKKGFKSTLKSVFRPFGYPKEEWEAERPKERAK